MSRDVLFHSLCPLDFVEAVPMPDQLEVLPRPEHDRDDEQYGEAERFPHLGLSLGIDLADDRIVPNVLANRVFEGFSHYVSRSTARSLALRARGFCCNSSSVAVSGLFVRTLTNSSRWSARNVCFAIRSSSE